jgi:hypothetical protein
MTTDINLGLPALVLTMSRYQRLASKSKISSSRLIGGKSSDCRRSLEALIICRGPRFRCFDSFPEKFSIFQISNASLFRLFRSYVTIHTSLRRQHLSLRHIAPFCRTKNLNRNNGSNNNNNKATCQNMIQPWRASWRTRND